MRTQTPMCTCLSTYAHAHAHARALHTGHLLHGALARRCSVKACYYMIYLICSQLPAKETPQDLTEVPRSLHTLSARRLYKIQFVKTLLRPGGGPPSFHTPRSTFVLMVYTYRCSGNAIHSCSLSRAITFQPTTHTCVCITLLCRPLRD